MLSKEVFVSRLRTIDTIVQNQNSLQSTLYGLGIDVFDMPSDFAVDAMIKQLAQDMELDNSDILDCYIWDCDFGERDTAELWDTIIKFGVPILATPEELYERIIKHIWDARYEHIWGVKAACDQSESGKPALYDLEITRDKQTGLYALNVECAYQFETHTARNAYLYHLFDVFTEYAKENNLAIEKWNLSIYSCFGNETYRFQDIGQVYSYFVSVCDRILEGDTYSTFM